MQLIYGWKILELIYTWRMLVFYSNTRSHKTYHNTEKRSFHLRDSNTQFDNRLKSALLLGGTCRVNPRQTNEIKFSNACSSSEPTNRPLTVDRIDIPLAKEVSKRKVTSISDSQITRFGNMGPDIGGRTMQSGSGARSCVKRSRLLGVPFAFSVIHAIVVSIQSLLIWKIKLQELVWSFAIMGTTVEIHWSNGSWICVITSCLPDTTDWTHSFLKYEEFFRVFFGTNSHDLNACWLTTMNFEF